MDEGSGDVEEVYTSKRSEVDPDRNPNPTGCRTSVLPAQMRCQDPLPADERPPRTDPKKGSL